MSSVTKSIQVLTFCGGLIGAGALASFTAVNQMRVNQYEQARIQKNLRGSQS